MGAPFNLKSSHEIESMKVGGQMLRTVLQDIEGFVRVGMTTQEVNERIESHISQLGGEPGFKRVKGYHWGSCICINEQIVHTPPSKRAIEDGDVVTIDAGVYYQGLHTDSATTIQVGTQDPKVTHFLETGRSALKKAVKQSAVGKKIGHISQAFEECIEGAGFSIVRELTGHGVGHELHEDPYIPCFVQGDVEKTLSLRPGMTLALEVMYAFGGRKIVEEEDGWSLKMADGSISATFEHTIALTENNTLILT